MRTENPRVEYDHFLVSEGQFSNILKLKIQKAGKGKDFIYNIEEEFYWMEKDLKKKYGYGKQVRGIFSVFQ